MTSWRPATREEVERLLAEGLGEAHPEHRARFELARVPLRRVPVASHPGEHVYVVAGVGEKVLYYSDVEEGWELDELDSAGGIAERGSSQFALGHVLHQLFGDPGQG